MPGLSWPSVDVAGLVDTVAAAAAAAGAGIERSTTAVLAHVADIVADSRSAVERRSAEERYLLETGAVRRNSRSLCCCQHEELASW